MWNLLFLMGLGFELRACKAGALLLEPHLQARHGIFYWRGSSIWGALRQKSPTMLLISREYGPKKCLAIGT
jgi:hypothetical protein